MKIITNTFILLFIGAVAYSQNTISGTFPAIGNQQVKLIGFEGFNTYTIDSVKADKKGYFKLSYSKKDFGMGYLAAEDNKAFIVVLAPDEDLKLEGEALALSQTIAIKKGKQNLLFGQYANEHTRREQTLSAWDFLTKIYERDSLFTIHQKPKNSIEAEILRINKEDETFLATLNPRTYLSWYLPLRKLVSSVPTIAQYRTHLIPKALTKFREMDYTDPRLCKSGLLRESIETHFWLIENSGRSLDSVFIEMNISIDHMIGKLTSDQKKFNEITDYLFKLLESRSLFKSSEYLAVKVLNEVTCTIDKNLASKLESYRAMKKGNTAPDFAFKEDVFAPGYQNEKMPQKLSDLKSKYTVVVFGASWCPACTKELSDINNLSEKWKMYGVEVVFVSLDEDKQSFQKFASGFPFISVCDYKKWESPTVKAFHIFSTPTIYLLDSNREILLRPDSANHLDSWVDWFLVKGNR
ncbi:MAG: peroxiredoxin family protein [Tenuifilaceae bacterium]